jgi:hypothetical protein
MEARAMNRAGGGAPQGGPHASRLGAALLGLLPLFGLAPGCASRQLQRSTLNQAQTLAPLQYQQVLDNLAMFGLNPASLPSLAMLKTGATQVGDTGTLGFLGIAGLNTLFGSSPTVAGTRTVVDQWGSSPVTDDNNLLLLRKAFQSAWGYRRLIDEGEANDLAHDLSSQIGTTADMSVDRDTLNTLISQNLLSGALARYLPPEPARRNPAPGTQEREQLTRAQSQELKTLAARLVDVSNIIDRTITSTLDDEILVKSFAFRYDSPLDVKLQGDLKGVLEEAGAGDRDTVYVAPVSGGLGFCAFDHDGKRYDPKPNDPQDQRIKKLAGKLEDKKLWAVGELEEDDRREVIKVVAEATDLGSHLVGRFEPLAGSSTGLAKETTYRINDLQKTLAEIGPGWFRWGPEKPKDACYVGSACFCGQKCYVWVCRDGLEGLEEFTRKMMKLASTFKDVQVVTAPSGIQFAPALTNTSR